MISEKLLGYCETTNLIYTRITPGFQRLKKKVLKWKFQGFINLNDRYEHDSILLWTKYKTQDFTHI